MDDSQSLATDTLNNLLTPSFDLTSLTSPRLTFYHFIGNDLTLTSKLYIDVFDGTQWNMGVALITFTQAAWLKAVVDLTPYKSALTRIRFRGVETNTFYSDISIDDVVIEEAPNCPVPLALGATNIGATTADIFWTTGGASSWVVSYGITGVASGSGNVMAATNDTVTLSSLTATTSYDFYVRDLCGPGDSSAWSGPYNFVTACAPFVAPYTESFDTTITPQCWSQSATSGGPWSFGNSSTNSVNCSAAQDHTGNSGNYAWMDHSGTDVGVSLEMGAVDVSALTTPYLEFYYWLCGVGYSPPNPLYIEAWDGTAWIVADSIVQATNGWEKFGFDLSGYTYGTNLLKVRFRTESGGSTSDFYGDNAIDDVSILEAPTCFSPTNLGATNESTTSADIYWTTGGATNWNVEYGTVGFLPGAGTSVNSTNDTLSLGSLTSATAYEFYVRDSCAVGDVSVWSGPFIFYTKACDTSNQCQFIFHLKDTYGDAWNGGEVTIYQSGVPIQVLGYPVINGAQNDTLLVVSIPLCDNLNTVAVISNLGSYSSEMGLEVYDADTMLLGSHLATSGLSTGDTLFSFMSACPTSVCDSAGTAGTAMVCATQTMINLASYIGQHSAGGMWMDDDATGALTDSIFDASMVASGSYNFTYYIAASGNCPADSATVSVMVDTVIMLGASVSDTICDSIAAMNLDDLLDAQTTQGGSWVEISSSGSISGGVFNPALATGQTVTVRYTVSNACGTDSIDISVYVQDCSIGLRDYMSKKLEMYPNPVTDVLNVSLKGETFKNAVIEVYSSNGKLLIQEQVNGNKVVKIDLGTLPKGMYTVKISSEEGAAARQITKM